MTKRGHHLRQVNIDHAKAGCSAPRLGHKSLNAVLACPLHSRDAKTLKKFGGDQVGLMLKPGTTSNISGLPINAQQYIKPRHHNIGQHISINQWREVNSDAKWDGTYFESAKFNTRVPDQGYAGPETAGRYGNSDAHRGTGFSDVHLLRCESNDTLEIGGWSTLQGGFYTGLELHDNVVAEDVGIGVAGLLRIRGNAEVHRPYVRNVDSGDGIIVTDSASLIDPILGTRRAGEDVPYVSRSILVGQKKANGNPRVSVPVIKRLNGDATVIIRERGWCVKDRLMDLPREDSTGKLSFPEGATFILKESSRKLPSRSRLALASRASDGSEGPWMSSENEPAWANYCALKSDAEAETPDEDLVEASLILYPNRPS